MDGNRNHAEAKGLQSDHAGSKRRKARISDISLVLAFPGFLFFTGTKVKWIYPPYKPNYGCFNPGKPYRYFIKPFSVKDLRI